MLKVLENPSEDEIKLCIRNREDFKVNGSLSQKTKVEIVESFLENAGYSVRVKTKGREASLVIPHPVSIANALIQTAHNLATYNPDWVIYKDVIGSSIEVKFFDTVLEM